MCKPGEPCHEDGMDLFEAMNDMRADPRGMEYVVVAETSIPGKFGTSIQGEPETVTKMVGNIMRTYIEAYSMKDFLMLIAAVVALHRERQAENEHDPALFKNPDPYGPNMPVPTTPEGLQAMAEHIIAKRNNEEPQT